MGLQQSKPQKPEDKSNKQSSSSYYGGNLTHNPQTNTTYQQFVIQQKHFDKFVNLIKSRQMLEHQHFITVKNFWKKITDNNSTFSCTTDKRIQVFVQYQSLTQNLSKKLDKLSEASKVIPESELKNIISSVLSCLIYLKQKNTCHGDIKPQSIYFDNLGQTKLLDSFFMNGGRTAYEIVMQNPSSMSLLSPQQLSRLRDKQFDDISLVHKNQMFSLGLTMYECMTFQPAMECYDLQKLKIKKDFFQGKEQIMYNNGYSKQFIDIVMGLILKPADARLDSNQLYDIIRQFSY